MVKDIHITISDEQYKWAIDNSISLSRFLRARINESIEQQKRRR